MIKIYRKTATIKAKQFDGSTEMIERYDMGFQLAPNGKGGAIIKTLEGDLLVHIGDWIATGVNGEHWAIADDVFKKAYAELPVISRMYADTIEEFKANHYRLSEMFDDWDWGYAEQELIARAWLDGYMVEAEK